MASHRNQNILSLSALSSVLLLVVLVLLNVAATRARVRMDLTQDQLFTLSEGTERFLQTLGDPATIQVYWHNVPEPGEIPRRHVEDLLEEMESAAGGRITVRWVDLDDEDEQREAERAGIETQDFQARSEGQLTATRGYASLMVEVGDQQEVIDNLVNAGPWLEYDLLDRLQRMTATNDQVVGMVSPDPESNPFARQRPTGRFDGFGEQVLRPQLQKGYRSNVKLTEPVSPEVDVLLVLAPEELEEKEVFHLEQFVLGGGRAFILLDPVRAEIGQAPATSPKLSGLEEWLAHLGVTVKSGVVGDFRMMLARPQIDMRRRSLSGLPAYPYWPLLRGTHVSQDNPATAGFDQVPLYWPVPLDIDEKKHEKAGRKVTILASTTEDGYHREDLIGLDNPVEGDVAGDLQSIPVMALVEGPMSSYWKGRPTPIEKEEEAAKAAEAEQDEAEQDEAEGSPDGAEPGETEEDESGPARIDAGEGLIIVLTDAELVSNTVFQMYELLARRVLGAQAYIGGLLFTQNVVDWLSGSDELLALRAKSIKPRRLEKKKPNEQKLITWANVAGVPLLILLAGVVVFLVRRYQR